MGLVPLKVAIWGPFVLINFGVMSNEGLDTKAVGNEWLGSAAEILSANGVDTSLKYVCRRAYALECNWKVWLEHSLPILSTYWIKILYLSYVILIPSFKKEKKHKWCTKTTLRHS